MFSVYINKNGNGEFEKYFHNNKKAINKNKDL